ncbi:MAG TPA: flagellar hook protein FlgE [Fimbriimonadaceae bacterium]|jgi:flagellar hook protein FlgE
MLQAMLASMSSIEAQQERMDVIGNNLANVNTTGFKGSDTSFEDLISNVITQGVNPLQFGQGVMVGSTSTDETQGTLNATGQPSDLAIQGDGYFVVANGSNQAYTRDGQFTLNSNGELVQASTGNAVLGWSADASGNIANAGAITPASTINIPLGSLSSAQATSAVGIGGNLSTTASATATATMGVNVYDSLGGTHGVNLSFGNRTSPPGAGAPAGATSSWTWTATEGTTNVGSSTSTGNQPLYFDANGNLMNPTALGNITIPAANGAAATTVALNFSGLTQNASSSLVQATSVNGAAPGSLQSFTIGSDGTITGVFSNGMTKTLAQVAMASFTNDQGLANLGDNLVSQTLGSGPPTIGVAGTGARGGIQAGFLEQSNVDVGTQFTNLIVTQRGYEANTKVVTAVNQMLQDLLSMYSGQ